MHRPIAGHNPYNLFILTRLQYEFHHTVVASQSLWLNLLLLNIQINGQGYGSINGHSKG